MKMSAAQKAMQTHVNAIVIDKWQIAIESFREAVRYNPESVKWSRFRNCSAETCKVGKYIFLKSYNTIVAFYNTETNSFYDILRYVYGYTATSAQHIAKFKYYVKHEYYHLFIDEYRYYEV